jgi:2-keto-4-pentenoate hydratase/2-oxohepta-3-ene-1,7-dioic acid hydratase in catechol pathway
MPAPQRPQRTILHAFFPGEPTRTRLMAALSAATVWAFTTLVGQSPEPYKLGMFQDSGRTFAGLVVGEDLVIDLTREGGVAPSATLHELTSQWNQPTADRLGKLAADARRQAPPSSHRLARLKTLPPITDPNAMINAARNYEEHALEMARAGRTSGTTTVVDENVKRGISGMWTRTPDDPRGNPYMFPKLKSSITGNGDPIVLPPGRTMIDWECELTVVVGKPAKRIRPEQAKEYIFGYTLMNDVSDREDRPDGRYGSDWLLSKSHDTFAPLGPFVVPAAFVPDPQNLRVQFSLNGTLMQDSTTRLMTHSAFELLAYVSNITTLRPGDLIATGTPAGVGTARVPPIYLKPGDRSVCTIERIGTLSNPVEAHRGATER